MNISIGVYILGRQHVLWPPQASLLLPALGPEELGSPAMATFHIHDILYIFVIYIYIYIYIIYC